MEGETMFRFTIRELLILTVTVGLAVGWWVEHRAMAVQRSEALDDAVFLAVHGKFGGGCGMTAGMYSSVSQKYLDLHAAVEPLNPLGFPRSETESP